MTTARSPLSALKRQADNMAAILKAAERGVSVPGDNGKLLAARDRPTVKFGVFMDDKIFTIEMPWTTVRSTSEAGISEFILKQMRESRDDA